MGGYDSLFLVNWKIDWKEVAAVESMLAYIFNPRTQKAEEAGRSLKAKVSSLFSWVQPKDKGRSKTLLGVVDCRKNIKPKHISNLPFWIFSVAFDFCLLLAPQGRLPVAVHPVCTRSRCFRVSRPECCSALGFCSLCILTSPLGDSVWLASLRFPFGKSNSSYS